MTMSFSALPRLRTGTLPLLLFALGCSPEQLSEPRERAAAIVVTPPTVTIVLDRTAQLNATVTNASGDTLRDRQVFWSSADESIATVSRSGLVTARKVGETQIAASADGQSSVVRVTVTARPVKSVRIIPDVGQVRVGRTLQLTAVVTDEANAVVPDAAVTWSSSDASVATVSITGVVQGVSPGTATITAESGGKTATATITVVVAPVSRVEVKPAKDTVEVADTVRFTAIVYDEDDNILTGREVVWTSDDPQIATVDANGLVRGVSPGTTKIRATSEGKTGTAEVTVVPIPVASVRITPSEATLPRGDTLRLEATALDRHGAELPGRSVKWATDAPSVATVDGSGLVTAIATGVATISAEIEGKRADARITVPAPVATSITVTPSAPVIALGDSAQLQATVLDEKGAPIPGAEVTWSTGDPKIATVSSTGMVKAQGPGETMITARAGAASGSVKVTVPQPAPAPVARVEVKPSSAEIDEDDSIQLTAVLYDKDGAVLSGREVTWASSRPEVAAVDENGLVRGRKKGTATITATAEGKTGSATIKVDD